MTTRALDRVLVVAATDRELAAPPSHGWCVVRCGVGPVEAGIATAFAIGTHRPAAILHVGIAGARRASGILPPALVIGRDAHNRDAPELPPHLAPPRVIPASPELLQAICSVLPEAPVLSIGTSAHVGGSHGTDVEAMEGFAVLRAAQVAGVPAIEVRAIANAIEEPDRSRWQFDAAFAAMTGVTPRLVEAIARCVR